MITIKSSISIFTNVTNVKLHSLQQLSTSKDSEHTVLRLKNPQIIYAEQHSVDKNVDKNKRSINPLQDVLPNDVENIIINRIDKKNKNHNKQTDSLEIRKNKFKSKKKSRSKIHINDEDDNLTASYSGLAKEDRSLELSLMRPAKPAKKYANTTTNTLTKNSKKNIVKSQNDKKQDLSSVSSSKRVKPNTISLPDTISIEELSDILVIPAAEIIKLLFLKGVSVTINQVVDEKIATLVAQNYGIEIEKNTKPSIPFGKLKHQPNDIDLVDLSQELRAPVITIFGHVDHGKTTLLHSICNSKPNISEAGGITQAIVAYEVFNIASERYNKIIFLDTPGHEAFSDMRIRGAQVTDIGILVVAADDGLKPQTIEAIKYLQDYHLPFLIAINKVDKKEANISKVLEELTAYNIIGEQMGGTIPILEISALKNINIENILSTILMLADKKDLRVNSKNAASGTILDSYVDRQKGPTAKLLIQNGTLHKGDYLCISDSIAKVRAIVNRKNLQIDSAEPSSVVEVWGLTSIPASGSLFNVIEDEKHAKKKLAELQKNKDSNYKINNKLNTRITFDASNKVKNDNILLKTINIILKTDTEGTIDAIIQAFSKIPQEKVQINLVSVGVGEITESDINLAVISQSTVLSFNSILSLPSELLANKSKIIIADFNVIYDLIEYIQKLMLELVEVEYAEKVIGTAVVETVFSVSKGNVAGCMVTSGKLKRNAYVRVRNDNELIYNGKLTSLKRIKEDVDEVAVGNECGVLCDAFDLWHKKYDIEAYEMIALNKTL